jgi:hypothetical protein
METGYAFVIIASIFVGGRPFDGLRACFAGGAIEKAGNLSRTIATGVAR